jgi:prepilin-type N-terminal cleavage/methylation domain-containing protein
MTRSRQGFSLIEVLVATLIIGVAIIPLLQFLPGTIAPGLISADELRLGAVGTRKTEELINRLRADMTSVITGKEACPDLPNCYVEWIISNELSSSVTGIGRLDTIAVVACQDLQADLDCDQTDPQVRFNTKLTSRP